MASMLEVSTHRATEAIRVNDRICVEGWSELLLALPEFVLTDATIDEHDELVAEIELPREVQACIRCGVIDRHPLHDWRHHNVRHLPVAGRATRLGWRKRLLACVEGCGTFVERATAIAPGALWFKAAARAAGAASTDLDTSQDEVLAFFDTRASNAATESANVKIKLTGHRYACG
jgi:transposase